MAKQERCLVIDKINITNNLPYISYYRILKLTSIPLNYVYNINIRIKNKKDNHHIKNKWPNIKKKYMYRCISRKYIIINKTYF